MIELLKIHGFHFIVETGRIRFLESIVLKRNIQFLPCEINLLKLERSVSIALLVGLLVIGSVIESEREETLVL